MPTLSMSQLALLAIVSVAGLIDWRTTIISNRLTFPGALLGLSINLITGGWPGALMAVAGSVLAMLVMVAPQKLLVKRPMMFGGDLKLMMVIGAFQGPVGMLITYLYFSLLYGAVTLWIVGPTLLKVLKSNSPEDMANYNETKQSKIPLGPWIALGTALSILLREPTLSLLGLPTTIGGMPVTLAIVEFQRQ